MGQYFKPVIRTGNRTRIINSWDYGCGLKLMEHSYVGNDVVNAVIRLLQDEGPAKIAWVGDYSADESLKADSEGFLPELFGDEKKRKLVLGMWKKAWGEGKESHAIIAVDDARPCYNGNYWLLNTDKKEYVHVRPQGYYVIHPLPLLTCSNPGSGGNYIPHDGEDDEKYFCSWCGDTIEFSDDEPEGDGWTEIPEDMFHEEWWG